MVFNFRIAVSDTLFSTLFSVWVDNRGDELNEILSEMGSSTSNEISAIFPSNLKDVLHDDLSSSLFLLQTNDATFSIRSAATARWLLVCSFLFTLSPLVSFSPPLTFIGDDPSTLITSVSELSKITQNITVDSVYVKTKEQDSDLNIDSIESIINYMSKTYPMINTRSIISEYKVNTLAIFSVDTEMAVVYA